MRGNPTGLQFLPESETNRERKTNAKTRGIKTW
jgi:hypothetical protein